MNHSALAGFVAAGMIAAASTSSAATAQQERNKKVVVEFYELAINKKDPVEAVRKYVGPQFIQHNWRVPTGGKGFSDYFIEFYKKYPHASLDIKRVFADGDYVIMQSNFHLEPNTRGEHAIDIVRLKDNRIVEHWDSVESVPEKTANGNTVFDGSKYE